MASAYKCDRCKKLFENYDQNFNLITENYVLEVGASDAYYKRFNLCPKCYEKFTNFMQYYREEIEEN